MLASQDVDVFWSLTPDQRNLHWPVILMVAGGSRLNLALDHFGEGVKRALQLFFSQT